MTRQPANHRRAILMILSAIMAPLILTACLSDIQDNQTAGFQQAENQLACSTVGQNRRVRNIMQAWYLYVDQMPERDPSRFASPQRMLDALRVDPPDRFSFLADRESTLSFTEEGITIGIGISLALLEAPDDYRVVDVFEEGPAAAAGMSRGDRLLTINGRTVEDWFLNEGLGAAFGPNVVGEPVSLTARRPDGGEYSLDLEKTEFSVNPVTAVTYFDLSDERRVAYFYFRSFIEPARQRLDELFVELAEAGVDELILDMRYNGGGRIAVAEQLAGQIGGGQVVGEVFVQLLHNEARSNNNVTRTFKEETAALGLDRLVVLATGRTASASELIVTGLRPFMDVEIIGDTTFGKPVGSYGFDVCDLLLFPTAFELRNASDEGDYFDGLPPTCEASDDTGLAFGDPGEASLAQALHYIETGSCDTAAARLAREKSARIHRPRLHDGEDWNPRNAGMR